jgi:hypothetical protein
MVKDLTEVRNSQREHMPDKAGSDLDVQTSLRGIAKTASFNKQHRFRDLYRLLNTEMLHLAWKGLKKSAAIADEDITVKEYGADLDANLKRLVERLKQTASLGYTGSGRQDRPESGSHDPNGHIRAGLFGLFIWLSVGERGQRCGQ